jgi:hypothetical protein
LKNKKKILSGFIFSLLILGIVSPLLSQSTFVTIDDPFKLDLDDAYIEVYVYDELTMNPVQGAEVWISDDVYNPIDFGNTDIDGFYNVTGLSLGLYNIEIFASGYEYNGSTVTIDYEDEGEYVEFYLVNVFVPGNGFIDVYVYDFETTNPILGAYVQLNNEEWYYIIGAATYNIEASALGYHYLSDYVTIDYDGEGEYLEFYLIPEYVPGVGFIDVYVYNNVTHTPMEGAEVLLYDEYYYYIDSGTTDIDGFYNFTGLGIGDYIVEANADSYVLNSSIVTIDYDGEEEYLMLYLSLFIRTLDILYPSDSQTVEGGSVLVGFDASEPFDLLTIDVYVNTEYITTISGGGSSTEFIVPVFENGTNTILLEGTWNDASMASDSVDIDSFNIIPIVKIKEGDTLNFRLLNLLGAETYDFNYTFTTWLTTFEMLTSVSFHQYDAGGTITQVQYWMRINVLNGYVPSDDFGMFLYGHFFLFSSLLPSPVVGDKISWNPTTVILTVNGSKAWEYTEVWTLEASMGMSTVVAYVEKSSNLVSYFLMPGVMEAFILETTIDFLNPYVSDVADFGYVEGDTGNVISWDATDMNPWNYSIYKDDVLQQSLNWTAGTPIVINVDGLTTGGVTSGIFVYRIVVMDLAGNIAEDTVTITVTHVVPELGLISNLVLISTIVFVAYVIMRKREK